MPELPEVECYARQLHQTCVGKTCRAIEFHRVNLRYTFDEVALGKVFSNGTKIRRIYRQHKQITIESDSGSVRISLGMSGSFAFRQTMSEPLKHEHVTITFNDDMILCYVDPRRFGFWLPQSNILNANPIADALSSEEIFKVFLEHKSASSLLKMVMMDQSKIGGIGNIYALEALFLSGISPLARCLKVPKKSLKKLAGVIPVLLNRAILAGGSTVSTYRNLAGDKGGFQTLHQVYGRENQPCLVCTTTIVRVVHFGRSSFYCPRCQK